MSREARKRCGRPRDRRGTILVLSAVLMIVMMGFIALSVDSGYMMNVQTEMDRAVDAGALAGAGALPAGYGAADSTARDIVSLNPVGSQALFGDELMIEAGTWHEAPNGDPNGRWFEPGTDMPDAVRVTAQRNDQRPLFFANVFGHDEFDLGSTAVAMFQPRDIMLVLDYSASMNDDSEFRSIDTLGRESVESNLLEIYGELGSPVFGNLNFDPNWMTIPGKSPANEHQPQIYVEYRYSEVYVTSTKPFSKVNVHKYNGSYKTYEGSGTWNDSRGVYEQTLDYNGNSRIGKVFVESGYNDSDHSEANLYEETFELYSTDDIRDAAKLAWGLNGVDYPYPQGGWDEWISYCISSRNDNKKAGYRYKFGYMNWVNYLLDDRPSYDESPDLWKTSEQPVTAVKNSVDVFIDFMQEYNTTDRVGMALYNSEDGWGQLEQELTTNYILVSHLARERQAGHYHNSTNIAAGPGHGKGRVKRPRSGKCREDDHPHDGWSSDLSLQHQLRNGLGSRSG